MIVETVTNELLIIFDDLGSNFIFFIFLRKLLDWRIKKL